MTGLAPAWGPQLQTAQAALRRGDLGSALPLLERIAAQDPAAFEPRALLGMALQQTGQLPAAAHWLQQAVALEPGHAELNLRLAEALARQDQFEAAVQVLQRFLRLTPGHAVAWLTLAQTLDAAGQEDAATRAGWQAIQAAQAKGQWVSAETTPPAWHGLVRSWLARVDGVRRQWLTEVLDTQIQAHGRAEMARFADCVHHYLGDAPQLGPSDPQQRPKFLYFPGLPGGPYHDPALQPWSAQLVDAVAALRTQALALLAEDAGAFEDFLGLSADADKTGYIGGQGERPAWDAFFFYRHGRRYDANHARAPGASALLDSIELCRVPGQAPEVCFSVLAPGSHILPHHGTTNTRLVYHLPLVVPGDCALNLIGHGEHAWQEGRPMMFDDTYQHEAWNRSSRTRIVLLMDCWNPHLTPAERAAVLALVGRVSTLEEPPLDA